MERGPLGDVQISSSGKFGLGLSRSLPPPRQAKQYMRRGTKPARGFDAPRNPLSIGLRHIRLNGHPSPAHDKRDLCYELKNLG